MLGKNNKWNILCCTGCSLNIVFFPLKVIFLNSASSVAALVFYLPGVCTHTGTKGKQRKARVRNIFKYSKKTIFNELSVGKICQSDRLVHLINCKIRANSH